MESRQSHESVKLRVPDSPTGAFQSRANDAKVSERLCPQDRFTVEEPHQQRTQGVQGTRDNIRCVRSLVDAVLHDKHLIRLMRQLHVFNNGSRVSFHGLVRLPVVARQPNHLHDVQHVLPHRLLSYSDVPVQSGGRLPRRP